MSDQSENFEFSLETGEIQNEEIKVLSVSALNSLIKDKLETQFPFVWLKAEISNFKPHTSGHLYFSLKDSQSQISAVMFRGYTRSLKFNPKDGLEVLIRGRISVYEPRGTYQVYVESMEPIGAGALQKAFEELKQKLSKEGLFSKEFKKELPYLPQKIALITSPTGAAVRDMIQVLNRRYKSLEVLILPALTQGQGSAESLIEAVRELDKLDMDVAIIGRGGGSIEDLWSFNDEKLARAIFECRTPIVSAVGHEIDFTICDFVSDVRAPTPSAAAELVTRNVDVVKEKISVSISRLIKVFNFKIQSYRSNLKLLSTSLVDPKRKLFDLRMKCDELTERLLVQQKKLIKYKLQNLNVIMSSLLAARFFSNSKKTSLSNLKTRLTLASRNHLSLKSNKFKSLILALDTLSPLSVLARGFSVVRLKSEDGLIINNIENLNVKDKVWIKFFKGDAQAEIVSKKEVL